MYQRKRLLLISQSQPLPEAQLRIDGSLLRADKDGQVEIQLEPGIHHVEVHAGGRWVQKNVRATGEMSLILVDLSPSTDNGVPQVARAELPVRTPAVYANRYVYEDVLGRGGMSLVIRARDRLLNRPVAIKLLSEELQENVEAQEIFMTEARQLATLAHPNLVGVHDIGVQDQRVFMVLEYVQGENLESLAHRFKGLPPALAVPMMIQLARGVAYLHTQGVIHRDLKPGNVILQSDGTLKLIDFGLARRLEDLAVRTTRVRGTPAYMAPEQIQGGALTPASDVYQLGATFFELLAGRLPFEEGDVSYAHVHRAAPSVNEFAKGVPAELAALIDRCLGKDPKGRPMHAGLVMESLQQLYASMRHHDVELPELQNYTDYASALSKPLMLPQRGSRLRALTTPLSTDGHIETGQWQPLQRPSAPGVASPQLSQQVPLMPPPPAARSPWLFLAGAALGLLLLGGGLALGIALVKPPSAPPALAAAPDAPAAAPEAPAAVAEAPAAAPEAPAAAPEAPAEAPAEAPEPEEMVFEGDEHLQDIQRSPEETLQARRDALQRRKDALKRQQMKAAAAAPAPPSPAPQPAATARGEERPRGVGLLPIKRDKSP
jgi:serine/threonine protein kinase